MSFEKELAMEAESNLPFDLQEEIRIGLWHSEGAPCHNSSRSAKDDGAIEVVTSSGGGSLGPSRFREKYRGSSDETDG
jgi:hypothetical protein